MPISGNLLWGAPDWALPAIAIAVVLAMIVVWNYGLGRASRLVYVAAFLLKAAAIALVAFCLLDPMRTGTRPRPQANLFPLLVDDSQSMAMRSNASGQTRGERVEALLDTKASWRVRLAQNFDVRPYRFASRLEATPESKPLTLEGEASALPSSLLALKERLRDRPVAGVLLFTDGNNTDDQLSQVDWSSFGFPIYPVIASNEDVPGDLRIAAISVSQSDFETAPVTVKVSLASQQMALLPVIVQLQEEATQKTIQEQRVTLESDGNAKSITIKFRPEKPGVGFYRVVAFRESDREAVEKEEVISEATFANNSRWLVIDRGQGPHRILYVSGRPNWEFKFIRRAVQSDPEVKLVGLLRIANKEAKFSFRDREVSGTNPLFAGLGDNEEDAAEQYDEPVMLRLGVEVNDELSAGFPRTSEELFGYEAVILDDIEPEFFTQDQLLMLRQFVAFRGGGLLMLGGQESFDANRFAASPLGELSPVYAPRRSDETATDNYRLEMTREGLLQPWFRLRETEDSEAERFKEMPSFNTLNPVGEAKPGAVKLATVRDGQGRVMPALVMQRFGKGKTAALTLGDSWKWSMRRQPGDKDDPARLWRQMMRWLVNDVPVRASVRIEPGGAGDGQVSIVTEVRDESYLPLDNAKVEIEVMRVSNQNDKESTPSMLIAQSDDSLAGAYKANYFASESGGHLAKVRVTSEDGSEIASTQSGWAAQPGQAEFRQWEINRELLQTIAEQTGGEIIDDRSLDGFVADLNNRKVPVSQVWTYPVWHRPWVMLMAILCLCGEWGLRRWKGLS